MKPKTIERMFAVLKSDKVLYHLIVDKKYRHVQRFINLTTGEITYRRKISHEHTM